MANRTAATGIVAVGSLGKPASARSAGVAGSTESDDRGVEPGDRARSREVRGGATTDDASGCGCADRTGFRSDYRRYGTLSVREASGELSGIGAAGKVQRESATAGPHHQTRKFAVALPAGGSGPSHGAEPARMAQPAWGLICTGCGVSNEITSRRVRFARRTARNRRWCAIEHREIDWASCSPSRGV